MSFSIGNLFRPTQQVQQVQAPGVPPQGGAPAQGAPAPLPIPGSTMQLLDPGAGNPNPAQGSANPGEPNASPLDSFSKMWETDPKATPPVDPWSAPILPSDPAKIRQAASGMNMLDGVPKELMTRAMSGQDPQAFMDVINAVGQTAVSMSTQLAMAAAEKTGTTVRDRMRGELPDHMRDFQLRNLPVDNPVLNNPAAAPMLDMARRQLQMKNPSWSPQQIQAEAVKYLESFATAMQPASTTPQKDAQGNAAVDWDSFLN